MVRMLGVSYAGRADKARAELGWRPRPLQTGMLDTFEWIAATEPADAGQREKRAATAILLAAVVLLVLVFRTGGTAGPTELDYTEFLAAVDAGEVASAEIDTDGTVTGHLVGETPDGEGDEYTTVVPVALTGEALLARLEANDVDLSAVADAPSAGSTVLTWLFTLLPIAALIGLWVWMARRAGGGGAMTSAPA